MMWCAINVATMHIERIKSRQGDKVYEQVLLRESYREHGENRSQVKKRTLLNLTKQPPKVIAAIELALKHKDDLSHLVTLADVSLKQGPSVGAVFVLERLARQVGLVEALGSNRQGKLALWQVISRVLDQGSRLSAVRLAQAHAVGEILELGQGFNEDDLYENLDWLHAHQAEIEDRLFRGRWSDGSPELFLYDVTSSYLEGEQNELADYGYNRDKKRGKKQIVIGLLCDQSGEPVSVQVFEGNTADLSTFESQVRKAADRFGCQRVTFVGDRGMIKSGQIKDLSSAGFHYITAITKTQIRALIKRDVMQLGLFDQQLCEVGQEGVRYILRKNPIRAKEMSESRESRLAALRALATRQNQYLSDHRRADAHKAWRLVIDKCDQLGLLDWVSVRAENRQVIITVDQEYLRELAELDGCYALKTDLPREAADTQTIHDRYKDLAMVERAFRTMKTGHLEVRPVFVRSATRTRGHVLVVMLAYLLVRALGRAWAGLGCTVEEGLDHLKRLCAMELSIKGGASCFQLPAPDHLTAPLLKTLGLRLPAAWPKMARRVVSKKASPKLAV